MRVDGRRLAVMAVCAGLLIACEGAGSAGSKLGAGGSNATGNTVTVKSTDAMRFEPANITVKAGQPVRLTLDNRTAQLIHDWTIDSVDGAKVHTKADGRQQSTLEFTAATPGTYQVYCAEPGHREAGMVGTLVVQ